MTEPKDKRAQREELMADIDREIAELDELIAQLSTATSFDSVELSGNVEKLTGKIREKKQQLLAVHLDTLPGSS